MAGTPVTVLPETRLEHQWEIAREFGYRDFPAVEAELVGVGG
jgi:CBS domain-containing protein